MEGTSYTTSIYMLEFHFKDEVTSGKELKVHHYVELLVQRPLDDSPTERAIIAHLQGASADYKLEINTTARIIFNFGEEPISVDDDAFLRQYGAIACAEFSKKANAVLAVMEAGWTLPEIPFSGKNDSPA